MLQDGTILQQIGFGKEVCHIKELMLMSMPLYCTPNCSDPCNHSQNTCLKILSRGCWPSCAISFRFLVRSMGKELSLRSEGGLKSLLKYVLQHECTYDLKLIEQYLRDTRDEFTPLTSRY